MGDDATEALTLRSCGRKCGGRRGGKDRFKIHDLFADERCSKAILGFLSTTDVGRLVPVMAEEGAQGEALEWERRERSERY
jgi:hypothetical protein